MALRAAELVGPGDSVALDAGPAANRQERRALRAEMRRLHDAFWAARSQAEPEPLDVATQRRFYAVPGPS